MIFLHFLLLVINEILCDATFIIVGRTTLSMLGREMIPIYSVIKYIDYVTKIILRKINFIFSMA